LTSIKDFITKVAKILKRKKDGEKLITQIDQQMDSVRIIRKSRKDSLRVLYIHARGPQVLLVGGVNTNVDALLKLAGAKNAAFEFDGMERLTGEDMQAMNPDFILMSKKGLESLQGRLYEVPAIFGSTAYRLGRVIVYDDYQLLNFGINSPKIALDLCKKLYKGQYFAPLPNMPFSTDPNQQPLVREQVKPEKVQPKTDVGLDDLKGGN
jgi:iron complex transport system substrate-binding protein